MTSRNLFLYWVGYEFKLITVLRKLIYLHATNGNGYKVHLITADNLLNYVPLLPSCFKNLVPAHQADYVRVQVICKYGGIWVDSDTLIMDSLDPLFHLIHTQKESKGFFMLQDNNLIFNGVFGSQSNTPLMLEWKKRIEETLELKQHHISWSEIGNDILFHISREMKPYFQNYKMYKGLENLYPINYSHCTLEYLDKPYDNYKTIVRSFQPLIVLVNSVYKKYEKMDLSKKMPLDYFLNKSAENYNKRLFGEIYSSQRWNNHDPNVPLSGPGSSLANTQSCSALLNTFIYQHLCKDILDLGCGDLTWVSCTPFFKDDSIRYTGVDVVESVIQKNKIQYSSKLFYNQDIINNVGDAKFFSVEGLIILRDVLFHLKNEEILTIFRNIKHKFKYIAITSCKNKVNTDHFDPWRFAEKNIHQEPFNISHDFEEVVAEPAFNRSFYVYTHEKFYK
jgi:hypothetical protein